MPRSLDLAPEFRGASLGDVRLARRLERIVESVAADPGASFPAALGHDADLEAFYRFVNNDAVTLPSVLQPHQLATVKRCSAHPYVLVIHDTTQAAFPGAGRHGLGRLAKRTGQGFLAHVSLAVVPGEARSPLGVLATETVVRSRSSKGRIHPRKRRADPNRESLRWHRSVERSETLLKGGARSLHVMDREGDSFELFAAMISSDRRFVIRLTHDRLLVGDEKLFASAAKGELVLTREVQISSRKPGRNPRERKFHPARDSRPATLAIRAARVVLRRPDSIPNTVPEELPLNVVMIREINVPEGVEPIEWKLITSEPVETAEEVAAVVDAYRSRWVIEELFKALKSGCQYERRQLESRHALEVCLGIFLPIAWRLLLLRSASRTGAENPCSTLTREQLQILRACGREPLSKEPTNREALLCLAAFGGHIKNNGDPGWMVLGRAYEKLLLVQLGWRAGKARPQM